MSAYYNENDPKAAAWLRELIKQGLIADGEVDGRSIVDVRPDDLRGFIQCHFFAGIGGWSYALRLAGWPDDRPVWTGSCPCQPFSAAGKGEGAADARHLWPEWIRLVREHRPVTIFGEQVGAAIRHGWLDLVCSDLENLDYAVGMAVVGAHSVGAPHIRQRLWFVADSAESRRPNARQYDGGSSPFPARLAEHGGNGRLADADGRNAGAERQQRGGQHGLKPQDDGAGERLADAARQLDDGRRDSGAGWRIESANGCGPGELGDSDGQGLQIGSGAENGYRAVRIERASTSAPSVVNGFWSNADLIWCRDQKWRPVEPGTFPLVDGVPARVGRLRGYGNAIVVQAAAEFIAACMDELNFGSTVGESEND